MRLPAGSDDKESTWNAGDSGSIPRKIPWRGEWLPTLVFLPGEFHGERSLVGYGPWGHKESDTTGTRLTHNPSTYNGAWNITEPQ